MQIIEYHCFYESKIGIYKLTSTYFKIKKIEKIQEIINEQFSIDSNYVQPPIMIKYLGYMDDYFNKKQIQIDFDDFDLNKYTLFQKQVLKEIFNVPYGNELTYSEIAKNIGNEKACKAIGNVCNLNPIEIFIPCHRIKGKNSNKILYKKGADTKQFLLNLEKKKTLT